ncbi:hypothetical protein ASD50_20605 [Mesorhizobium sp. Root552]|jgi:hypothetical protein|uniref:hypothetical protein n=1 Tax=Mesorhizobium sp. Root552 TaxID=1736555 RepID=UPI000700C6FC|nr:hypothetical protein [Mesorhizobium sp. Root552]KQZ25827.1 hypothetical protein ASD50_20605 [Mesorhizobium sp. Root552]
MLYELEPAATIIKTLGGLKAVSEIAGVSRHSVMRWRYPISVRGTGGTIPHQHHRKLLVAAKERDIELSPLDFFPEELRR